MKRCIWLVIVGLLYVPPLLAQSLARVDGPEALFFALTPEQAAQGGSSLEIRFSLNGRPYLQETLTLEGKKDLDRRAFELLSARPDLRAGLFELSRDRSLRITATVLLDGAPIRELRSFGDLLRYNRQLKLGSFLPTRAASRVRDLSGPAAPLAWGTAKGLQPDPECVDDCMQDYYTCTNNSCYDDLDPNCEWCQTQHTNCVSSCPLVCVDPLRVYEETRTELDFAIGLGTGCHIDQGSHKSFAHYQEYYTHTRVRITEYCDSSETEQVLSTWGSSRYCATPLGSSCFCYSSCSIYTGFYC